MNWLKTWLVKLLGPKFIRDKVAHLLTLLAGLLVSYNLATVEQAQALSDVLLPILTNAFLIAISIGLSIDATEKAEKKAVENLVKNKFINE